MKDNPNYYFTDRSYKPKLICCECRKVFKRKLAADVNVENDENRENMTCPNCGNRANYVGPKFRAPKIENLKAWKSIKILNDLGTLNFIGFASNKIVIPESNKGLVDLLKEMKADFEINIRRWVSYEFDEQNKLHIKAFSDIVKKIDKYLKKTK